MAEDEKMLAFGPVPSRRLGKSIGINNIPPKICTYSCIYCQVGKTLEMRLERQPFYDPEILVGAVRRRIAGAVEKDEPIDYLTFVPDGEPTIDTNLGREIELLRDTGFPVAVITNSSLLGDGEVREELAGAGWVSLKIDAVDEKVWRGVNRPHGKLELDAVLEGISEFSRSFEGTLATETMLVEGINDTAASIAETADLIAGLDTDISYISIPTRPPAEERVRPPSERTIHSAFRVFEDRGINTEYLIGYEGNAFASTGVAADDILSITSVHPMRREAVETLLDKAGGSWEAVERLLRAGEILEISYEGETYYMRRLGR